MSTKALATFTANLKYNCLSPHSVLLAKKCILDCLGIAIRGSKEQPSKIMRKVILKSEVPEATLFGSVPQRKVSVFNAAFCNSVASHSLDFDDLHNPSIIHLACVVVPPTLAIAETEHKSGKDIITAVCAGYEAGARAGEAIIPESYFFWHTTGTAGIFGSAAASANILGLNEHDTLMCYGSAGTQAAGLWEFLKEGAMSKTLHAGKASYGGALAAYLSREGFTAASRILEGEKGFCRAMVANPHLDKLTEGLGSGRLKIDDNSFKPYACCKHAHATLYAIQVLRKEYNLKMHDIKSITLHANNITNYLINNSDPENAYGCKFSIQYCAAAMMKFGKLGVEEFSASAINDPEICELMKRVRVIFDKDIEKVHEENPAKLASRVVIELFNGKILDMQVDFPKGDPENTLTWEEICDKFMSLAVPVYSRKKAEKLSKFIENLEKCPDFTIGLDECLKEE